MALEFDQARCTGRLIVADLKKSGHEPANARLNGHMNSSEIGEMVGIDGSMVDVATSDHQFATWYAIRLIDDEDAGRHWRILGSAMVIEPLHRLGVASCGRTTSRRRGRDRWRQRSRPTVVRWIQRRSGRVPQPLASTRLIRIRPVPTLGLRLATKSRRGVELGVAGSFANSEGKFPRPNRFRPSWPRAPKF